MKNNWTEYWQKKNEFDKSMDVNYQFFLKRVKKYVPIEKTTTILDLGSGPGHLEDALFDKVKEIHGLDVSERYNSIAREKHRNHPNVFFHHLPASDYLNFSALNGKKFDLVIVMSVLQYYKDKSEIQNLLQKLRSLTLPGSKVLLCDLIVRPPGLSEIFEILLEYLKASKFLYVVSLFFRLRFSKYYSLKKNNGLLSITEQEWKEMLSQENLDGRFIEENLTIHKRRKNILINIR